MCIWIVSIIWLLWIMLLWTFMCKFLCEHVFILMCLCLEKKLLCHEVTQWLSFWRIVRFLSKVTAPFYILTSNVWRSNFSTVWPVLVIMCFSFFYYSYPSGYEVTFSSETKSFSCFAVKDDVFILGAKHQVY